MDKLNQYKERPSVEAWLNNRRKLLNHYWQILALPPFETADGKTTHEIRQFFQALIDYTAESHFKIYPLLLPSKNEGATELNLEVIYSTTDLFVELNDRFDKDADFLLNDENKTILSILGEQLCVRFELEDKLLVRFEQSLKNQATG